MSNLRPFSKGMSGNPAGRPRGSRNKLGESFIAALADDFEANGVGTIEKVRTEFPHVYIKVVASLMPKEMKVSGNPIDDLSDEELEAAIATLNRSLRESGVDPLTGRSVIELERNNG